MRFVSIKLIRKFFGKVLVNVFTNCLTSDIKFEKVSKHLLISGRNY
jgi:hypothetical protein